MSAQHPTRPSQGSLEARIARSALMKQGGCAIYDHFPSATVCARLLVESSACLHSAVSSVVVTSDSEEVRGGSPARRLISAGGGSEQAALYNDPQTARFLSRICNGTVRPTGERGTFTYYARPGDHLGLHRDIETCDIAFVTCLLDRNHDDRSVGGRTVYYPTRQHEALSRIRATPRDGAVSVRVPVGSTIVMFGGLVPHLIEPLAPGGLRIVSILCFRVCGD